jgi:hypothetical protein
MGARTERYSAERKLNMVKYNLDFFNELYIIRILQREMRIVWLLVLFITHV